MAPVQSAISFVDSVGKDGAAPWLRTIRTIRFSPWRSSSVSSAYRSGRDVDRAFLCFFEAADLHPGIGHDHRRPGHLSSLVNSHLFDFGQGWLYVFGVGVAAA